MIDNIIELYSHQAKFLTVLPLQNACIEQYVSVVGQLKNKYLV